MSSLDPMPPAIPAMWRALKRGYAAEPRLLIAASGLTLLTTLPDAFGPILLKLLVDGTLAGRRAVIVPVALALGASTATVWFLRVVSERVQRKFRDRVTVALEAHVATLQASIDTLEHHERPEYLDRLSVLRNQVFVLDHMYSSLFTTSAWILRLGITLALLASIHPALLLLALAALPAVAVSAWRPGPERRAEEQAAPSGRHARHLFEVATSAASAKEVRVLGIDPRVRRDHHDAWEQWYRPVAMVQWVSAAWQAAAWAFFGACYLAAIYFIVVVLAAPAGSVLLALAAGSRLSAYVGAAVGEIGFLRGIWLDGSRRLAWLEDYAAARAIGGAVPAPLALTQGIRLDAVSFAYPGTTRRVLDGVSLHLKPGSVVAIIGENGAGKTTLAKLLCRLYQPQAGRILIDDHDLADMAAVPWRSRIAGAFQDFFKFELLARQSIGIGDLPRLDDDEAICRAIGLASADDVIEKLPDGLETQLGPSWPGGVDLSFGQWQKIALGRAFMREAPLLLILDEPTAALDAETEHALFERYTAAARHGADASLAGRIVILVSHRFSTVRMADEIIVLDGARVVESGSHQALMAQQGRYAELYTIQANAYG